MKEQVKNNKKSLWLSIIVAAALLSVCCLVFLSIGIRSALGSSPQAARNGVVYVYTQWFDAYGQGIAASGTGWAIGKPGEAVQYIVTNGHVVEGAYNAQQGVSGWDGMIKVVFSAAEGDAVDAQVVYYSQSSEKDLAILKLPSPSDKRSPLLLRASDSVDSGEEVYALGYPGVSDELQANVRYDIKDITMTQGIISKRVAVKGTKYEAFQMDTTINHGNSGGPLVDKKGFVLGVNTLGLVTSVSDTIEVSKGNVFYASVIDQLSRVLKEEGIPFAYDSHNNFLIFLFAPLLALALLTLAFATSRLRKMKKLAVAGASNSGEKAKVKLAEAPANNRYPKLRGLSGKFSQAEFSLERKLVLGRDAAKCNIVFDASTPGISALHCMVSFDENQDCFTLMDLGSSFGTFLGNGRKLSPNVAEKLYTGDSFYLGDANNRFMVSKQ